MWYVSSNFSDQATFIYKGILAPGQSSSFYVTLKAKLSSSHGYRYNYTSVYDSGTPLSSSSASYNIVDSPDYTITKSVAGNGQIVAGQQFSFNIRITNVKGHIDDFFVEEHFPENWEYVTTYGPTFFVHSVSENGVHRWNFVPNSLGPTYLPETSFSVLFKCDVPGNYINTIISGADCVPIKTSSANITIRGTILDIEKIANNQSVKLGEQTSFTIRIHNSGNESWSNFKIKDIPTTNLVYDHCIDTTDKWILNQTTSIWTYNGTIVPNETVELELFFNTTGHGVATNEVQLNYGPLVKSTTNSTL